ncbi:MAG: hypothetical protein JNJ54_32830 [Myxococcaceae bacterium]|nr:hypothetical protein [Myxococcaceae bacterium]
MRPAQLALLVVSLSGCQSLTDGAREQVSKAYSCPLERVVGVERSDLKAMELRLAGVPKPTPPPDIAADPARLAMWQQSQAESRTQAASYPGVVIEVKGCGLVVMMDCYRKNKVRWGESSVGCSEISKASAH